MAPWQPVLDEALTLLEEGAADPRSPWRTLALATTNPDGAPGIRTIVLRRFTAPDRLAELHTDARSPKMTAILADNRAALHGWDPVRRVQIRLDGRLTLADAPATQAAWGQLPETSRVTYAVALAPGTPIADPEHATPSLPPSEAQAVFRLLRLHVDALEYLSLAHGAHRRVSFHWQAGEPTATWLVP
jgi:pyridoxine/pyridoxamine 5'-phosphate oxidase